MMWSEVYIDIVYAYLFSRRPHAGRRAFLYALRFVNERPRDIKQPRDSTEAKGRTTQEKPNILIDISHRFCYTDCK